MRHATCGFIVCGGTLMGPVDAANEFAIPESRLRELIAEAVAEAVEAGRVAAPAKEPVVINVTFGAREFGSVPIRRKK